jgi:hypothetical protein
MPAAHEVTPLQHHGGAVPTIATGGLLGRGGEPGPHLPEIPYFGTGVVTVSRVAVELPRRFHPDGGRFLIKDYPKDGEHRQFKLSPQIVQKIGQHIAAHDIGPDDLFFTMPQLPARPLRLVADPATLGLTIPNAAGRRYQHGTLSGYSAGRCPLRALPGRLCQLSRAAPGALAASRCVEVDRLVNGIGGITLLNRLILVGSPLAGQRARIRLDGQLMHVITQDGVLWRTLPCPIPPGQRHRLQGVRLAGPAALPEATVTVQRRVSSRGGIQVARQRIHVGMTHAGKIVTVVTENNSFHLVIDGETVGVVPRTTSREIDRYKAYATHPGRR